MFSHGHFQKMTEKMKFTVQKPFLAQMIEKIRHLDFDFGLNGIKILRLQEFSSKQPPLKIA